MRAAVASTSAPGFRTRRRREAAQRGFCAECCTTDAGGAQRESLTRNFRRAPEVTSLHGSSATNARVCVSVCEGPALFTEYMCRTKAIHLAPSELEYLPCNFVLVQPGLKKVNPAMNRCFSQEEEEEFLCNALIKYFAKSKEVGGGGGALSL